MLFILGWEGGSHLLSWKQDAKNKTRMSYASGILSQGIGARKDYGIFNRYCCLA
jgi:hypothetical protein